MKKNVLSISITLNEYSRKDDSPNYSIICKTVNNIDVPFKILPQGDRLSIIPTISGADVDCCINIDCCIPNSFINTTIYIEENK